MYSQLFQKDGQRKYLTPSERSAFLKAAEKAPHEVRTFCLVLAHTGCRITEVLSLTIDRIDFEAGTIIVESLKKRKEGVFRAIPVPSSLLQTLDLVHRIREGQQRKMSRSTKLWSWSRTTGWRRVKEMMKEAGVANEAYAMPKGLRHGLGVQAVQSGIPLNMAQKWLGHSDIKTTAIYANAVGEEERTIAKRMWENQD